uniref:Uncharacterized protein n=1 Tax=Arundo donax TaxID=35708 RepID=A0A0A9B289_ARUDO
METPVNWTQCWRLQSKGEHFLNLHC